MRKSGKRRRLWNHLREDPLWWNRVVRSISEIGDTWNVLRKLIAHQLRKSQRPWCPMISQLWNGWQQPVLTNPLSTTVVSEDQAPTGNNDQSSRTTHPIAMPSSQQASPKGSESQVRTRSGRLVRPPNHFKNCVALKGTNKWRLRTASA